MTAFFYPSSDTNVHGHIYGVVVQVQTPLVINDLLS